MKITISRIKSSMKMCITVLPALVKRLFNPNIWLITERPDQARDNGYIFFKYLRQNHPECEVYYVIDKKSADKAKIEEYGNIIDFNSWSHYFFYIQSKIHISAHVNGCCPSDAIINRWIRKPLGIKDVFIPHGVNVQIAEFCKKKYAQIDLYISCSPFERQNMISHHGYAPEEVALTGFPRQDGWWDFETDQKLIIMMPTWRVYLAHEKCDAFEETEYYKAFQGLINNSELNEFLLEHDIKFVFYPHSEMRKFIKYFSSECKNVEIAYSDSGYDIQMLLKKGALLITDYSSLYFDYAYMGKPIVYFQFDQQEFRARQYAECGFDVEKYGFGPICKDVDGVVAFIKESYSKDFCVNEEYYNRMLDFFAFHDRHNCERVYQAIIDLKDTQIDC